MAGRRSRRGALTGAMSLSAAALLVGCLATIDRSKIAEADASVAPTDEDGGGSDAAADDGGIADGPPVDGRADGGPACTGHDFCAHFDSPGTTAMAFGFEPHPVGEQGTGVVTIEGGGKSLPSCARIRTPADPSGKPGGTAGLRRSLDPTRGLSLAFDVQIQQPAWQGYDGTPDVKFATVTTANDTIALSLHISNPARVEAAADRLFISLADPQSQVVFGFAPFPFGTWVHVAIRITRSGVEVKVADQVELTRGPISFDKPGRDYNAFVLGAIREFEPAPALDVRVDNVVLDYL